MAMLPIKHHRPQGARPHRPVINRSNRFGKKAIVAYPFQQTMKDVVAGYDSGYTQQHPTGHVGFARDGLYFYSDHGGSNDDRWQTDRSFPTIVSANPEYKTQTLVLEFVPEDNGHDQQRILWRYSGFDVQGFCVQMFAGATTTWTYGWMANTSVRDDVTTSGWPYGKLCRVVLSMAQRGAVQSDGVMSIAVSVDGETTYGSFTNDAIGSSVYQSTSAPYEITNTTYSNYYHFKGTFRLFAALRGFYDRDEMLALLHDPYQIFDSGTDYYFIPAAGGSYSLTADYGSYALSGQAASLLYARIMEAAQGGYTLTGLAAALTRAYTLSAGQGSYALSGQAVDFAAARILEAAQGVYAATGQDAELLRSLILDALQGVYNLTGQDATLTYSPAGSYELSADAGSYALAGQVAGLIIARVVSVAQGTYSVSGQDAALRRAFTLAAENGSYSVSGQVASLLASRLLAAAGGTYSVSGQDLELVYGLEIELGQGAYTLTGGDANLIVSRLVSGEVGLYEVYGPGVGLNYSGAVKIARVNLTLATRTVAFELRQRRGTFTLN